LFLDFGYKVDVRFNFRSQQTQAGMQVSSVILFRLSLFNRFIIQRALSQITNIEHIFSAKSIKRGKLPGCPPPGCEDIFSAKSLKQGKLPGCPSLLRAWLPFNLF